MPRYPTHVSRRSRSHDTPYRQHKERTPDHPDLCRCGLARLSDQLLLADHCRLRITSSYVAGRLGSHHHAIPARQPGPHRGQYDSVDRAAVSPGRIARQVVVDRRGDCGVGRRAALDLRAIQQPCRGQWPDLGPDFIPDSGGLLRATVRSDCCRPHYACALRHVSTLGIHSDGH